MNSIDIKKNLLFNELELEFQLYPDVSQIRSIRDIAKSLGLARTSVNRWIREFLIKNYGEKSAENLFYIIWNSKSRRINSKAYEDVKINILEKRGKIITTEEEFNSQEQSPTLRYISLTCDKNHKFRVRVNDIFYNNRWCPKCQSKLCERVTRYYMESLFKLKFPETTLKRALDINGDMGGRLKYDGFSDKVILKNKTYKIAFEYDGIQHDVFPNQVHGDNLNRFIIQQARDRRKRIISENNNVILISIKEVNGFSRYNLISIQDEIITQFECKTNILLKRSTTPIPCFVLTNEENN